MHIGYWYCSWDHQTERMYTEIHCLVHRKEQGKVCQLWLYQSESSLTRFLSTGRKSVVVAILDMTSVTDVTMAETSRPMTGWGKDPNTLNWPPSQSLRPQTRLLNGECVTCMHFQPTYKTWHVFIRKLLKGEGGRPGINTSECEK